MRKKYIDLLRQTALFHMFFQHAFLVLLLSREKTGFTNFLDEIIPICPALFLFIAGYSVTLSSSPAGQKARLLLKRGCILILCGMLLFFIEYGVQMPDLLFTPGILHTIGIFLLLMAFLFSWPRPVPAVYLACLAGTVLYLLLSFSGLVLFPLTTGYEPWLPTILFGLYGAACGLFFRTKDEKKALKPLLFLFGLGLAISVVYTIKYGFCRILYDDIGRLTIERTFNVATMLPDLFTRTGNSAEMRAYVWNFSLHSFIAVFAIILMLFSLCKILEKPFLHKIPSFVFLPGRFAFVNYFFHLTVLAVIAVTAGFNILTKVQFYLLLFTLFAASYGVSYLSSKIREKMKGKKLLNMIFKIRAGSPRESED